MGNGAVATAIAANPISAGLALGGAILGAFGMRKRRKEERRRRAREKKHALKAQTQLLGSVSAIRDEYRERAGFGRQAFELGQARGLLNFKQDSEQMAGAIGQTGLSYSGTLETQRDQMETSFQQENLDRRQGYQEQRFGLEKQLEGSLRGVQAGLLDLEATAMSRGYNIGNKSNLVNTQADFGGV